MSMFSYEFQIWHLGAVLLLLLPPFRWVASQIWEKVMSPFLLKKLPSVIQWLFNSHIIVLKNMMPRAWVVKTLEGHRIRPDRK